MTALERLRELTAEATPGPWSVVVHSMTAGLPEEWAVCGGAHILGSLYTERDNNLVAAMRNALPALLTLAVAQKMRHGFHLDYCACLTCEDIHDALAYLERPA